MPCLFLHSERSQINCYMLLTFIMAPCSPLTYPQSAVSMVTEVEEEHFNKYEDVASLDERQEFGMEEDVSVKQKYKICITIKWGWPLLSKRKYSIFVPVFCLRLWKISIKKKLF